MAAEVQTPGGPRWSAMVELVRQVRLAWRLLRDPAVPRLPKLIPLAAVVYLLSPVDLVADLPIIGQVDDVLVLWLALRLFLGLARPAVSPEAPGPPTITTTYRVQRH